MAVDFRIIPFHITNVGKSGRYIGRGIYWKLYVIENVIRVVIHSVLTVENPDPQNPWWTKAIDKETRRGIVKMREDYIRHKSQSEPGLHEVYYLNLSNLRRIIRSHAHLFRPVIPEIDNWMLRLDRIRLPRNIVGHMNWLNSTDKNEIDKIYSEVSGLIKTLTNSRKPIPILIPRVR